MRRRKQEDKRAARMSQEGTATDLVAARQAFKMKTGSQKALMMRAQEVA